MAECCPPGSWPACQAPEAYQANGSEGKIGELPIYHVGSGEKAVLILPDIFGWAQNKGRFFGIADTLAAQGFQVLLSDPFHGDTAAGKDIMPWITSHPYDGSVGKDIEACVKFLQDKGCTSVGVVGFCWGVWALCKAASVGVPFKCGVGAHPSTRLEGMFGGEGAEQSMIEKVTMPVLLLPAGNDPDNLKEGGAVSKALESKGGSCITFPDMTHGWLCRGDLSDATVARDVELGMKHMVTWFKEQM